MSEPQRDWMSIMMEVPYEIGMSILDELKERGFVDVDYCEMEHKDGWRAVFGPCEPREPAVDLSTTQKGKRDGRTWSPE